MPLSDKSRDMLVRLYDLPRTDGLLDKMTTQGILVRMAFASERDIVVNWTSQNFSSAWGNECRMAFAGHPVHCFVAIQQGELVGISSYDGIARGVMGPLGIHKRLRGKQVGKALVIETLHHMRAQGYAYAVLGWISPRAQPFFHRTVGAEIIPNSIPKTGMYKGLLEERMNSSSGASR